MQHHTYATALAELTRAAMDAKVPTVMLTAELFLMASRLAAANSTMSAEEFAGVARETFTKAAQERRELELSNSTGSKELS